MGRKSNTFSAVYRGRAGNLQKQNEKRVIKNWEKTIAMVQYWHVVMKGKGKRMLEGPCNHTPQFQQAIATTITCRTIIKYSSKLSADQKAEILAEIEKTLNFLEKGLEANAIIESNPTFPQQKLRNLLATDGIGEDEEQLEGELPGSERKSTDLSLQNLRKLYHAYLSNEPGKGIPALEVRYKTVMGVLDQLQLFASQRHDATAGDVTAENLLHRVRGFVTAVYCMFREFAVLLSNILEGKNIDMDTEALALLQKYQIEAAPQQLMRDITPLLRVYGAHLQLQGREGALADCARDATAFLIFLEEGLDSTFSKRKEIAAQLKTTAGLLNELIRLLTDYEQAVATIIQSPSTSR